MHPNQLDESVSVNHPWETPLLCRYFTFYPNISGIFLDAASSSCTYVNYYANLIAYTRGFNPDAVVALNWGAGELKDRMQTGYIGYSQGAGCRWCWHWLVQATVKLEQDDVALLAPYGQLQSCSHCQTTQLSYYAPDQNNQGWVRLGASTPLPTANTTANSYASSTTPCVLLQMDPSAI